MAAVSPAEIVDALLQAIEDSGYSGAYISRGVREHPRRFAVASPENRYLSVWVYIWTLTHGGRPSLPDEYRIQMTSVQSPLEVNPNGPTVLLGYEPNLRLFAGFDLLRHQVFTTGSPSVQVNISTVRQALQSGLAFNRKSNSEIAVGIRSDQLVGYICNAKALHQYGRFPDTFRLLGRATELEDISEAEINALTKPRKRIVETVSRLARSGSFRQQVINAYGNRCAVTRAQLRLVDAAHILPVGAPGSSDNVRNGIALNPTYHRAYDAGLIFLDEDFVMRINRTKVAELRTLDLTGGLTNFEAPLGRIHLPPDRQQWPSRTLIRQANRFRNVS